MAAETLVAGEIRRSKTAMRAGAMRWFIVGIAVWFWLVAIAGFTPSYMDFSAGTFQIDAVVHLHGVIMASWLGLFLTQALFAATGRMGNHAILGRASIVLAGVAWASMWIMTFHAFVRATFPDAEFLVSVLLAQLEMIVLFPLFFLWGFLARGEPDWHRRLMILATAVTLQAAVDRMFWLPGFDLPAFWDHALRLYVIVLSPLYVFDILTLGRFHRATAYGTGMLLTVHILVSALWVDEGWHAFVHGILGR